MLGPRALEPALGSGSSSANCEAGLGAVADTPMRAVRRSEKSVGFGAAGPGVAKESLQRRPSLPALAGHASP